MSYYVGTRISSVYRDPDLNNPADIEYYIGCTAGEFIIPELLLFANYVFKQSSLYSEKIEPVKIVGTNDEDLLFYIQAQLEHLGADYSIIGDYEILDDSIRIINEDDNTEHTSRNSATVKYMFVLNSTDTKAYNKPVIARTGSTIKPTCNKKAFDIYKSEDAVGGRIPNNYFDPKPNPENKYYSNTIDNEDFDYTLAMVASNIVLEVIALGFDDEFFYELEHEYKEKAKNGKIVKAQPSDDLYSSTNTSSSGVATTEGSGLKPIHWLLILAAVIFIFTVL